MKKSFLLLLTTISLAAFSQKWEKTQPNILFAQDKNQNFSTIKVGIRTDNPAAALDVNGRIKTRGNAFFDSLAQALSMKAKSAEFATAVVTGQLTAGSLLVNGTITASGMNVSGQTQFENLTVQGRIRASRYASSSPLIFETPAFTERARIDDVSGNFGIGTSSPTEKLHVLGKGLFEDGNGNGVTIGFNSVNSLLDSKGNGALLINFHTGKDVAIGPGKLTATGDFESTKNVFLATQFPGKVGIGTISPTEKFEVMGGNGKFGNANGSVTVGFNTVNGLLDYNGTSGALLINFHSGKDVTIGPGKLTATGNFEAVTNTYLATGSGNVGIGTTTPNAKLDIDGGGISMNNISNTWTDSHWRIALETPTGSVWKTNTIGNYFQRQLGFGMTDNGSSFGWYWIYPSTNISGQEEAVYPMSLTIDKNTFAATLKVTGKIKVTTPGSDFVFENSYKKMSWKGKEFYYKKNKRLPYMDAAAEMQSEGMDIGKNFSALLQNVEEDRLDITELFKRMEKVESQNENLKKENEDLKKGIKELKDKGSVINRLMSIYK